MLLQTQVYKYLFETLITILLSVYPEVALLDHMVVLFLIKKKFFLGITVFFSIVAVLCYIPSSNVQGFQFLYFLTILVIFCFV